MSKVVLINGAIGAGKSTIGRRLSHELQGDFFDMDTVVYGSDPDWPDRPADERHVMWRHARQRIGGCASALALAHRPVVVSGPFHSSEHVGQFRRAVEPAVAVHVFTLVVPDDVLRYTRVEQRAAEPPSQVWHDELARIRAGEQEPQGLIIDNSGPIDQAVQAIMTAVR